MLYKRIRNIAVCIQEMTKTFRLYIAWLASVTCSAPSRGLSQAACATPGIVDLSQVTWFTAMMRLIIHSNSRSGREVAIDSDEVEAEAAMANDKWSVQSQISNEMKALMFWTYMFGCAHCPYACLTLHVTSIGPWHEYMVIPYYALNGVLVETTLFTSTWNSNAASP